MEEGLIRWERAIEEGIDIPSEIKAESDSYRLNYDELMKMCSLSKLHDQDYYSFCSNPRFWEKKMEYDLTISYINMSHDDFLKLSLKKGWTIYVGILLKLPSVNIDIITSTDINHVVKNGYYNIVKLLLNHPTKSLYLKNIEVITKAVLFEKNDIALLLMNNIPYNREEYTKILSSALIISNVEIIKYIFEKKLRFNQENLNSIFEVAGNLGNRETLELLKKYGYLLEGDNLHSALIGASENGMHDMMKYLLELGANPAYKNYKAFWNSYNNSELESVKILLDTGKIPDDIIEGLYQIGSENDFEELLELLDNYRYLLKGDKLHNALIRASENGRHDKMKYLLKLGADPAYKNYKAFWNSYDAGELESVRILLDTGKIPDDIIEDLYQIGIENHFEELLELLKNYR